MHSLPKLLRFSPESGFGPGSGSTTPHSVIYGDPSDSNNLRVTNGNVLPTLVSITGNSGDITIAYTLTDLRAATASITPQYSLDGINWSTATKGTGGDAITGLTTSSGGTSHTFVWDTVSDVGKDFKADVFFRIKAFDLDNQAGDFELTNEQKVQLDNAPDTPTLVTPTDGWFDKDETPTFIVTIPDPIEDDSDLHAKIEIDTNENFNSQGSGPLRTYESRFDQTGWEYQDGGGNWQPIPFDGIPIIATPALVGNNCRFTIQTPDKLTLGQFHWRMSFGGVTS